MAIDINKDTIAEAVVNRLRNSIILTPRLLTLSQAATYLKLATDACKAKAHAGRIPTEIRCVAQAYIATLKVRSILLPKLDDIKATKLSSARVKEYVEVRLKIVNPGTVNRKLGLLHRAFRLEYNQDPPLVARVPHFPKLIEGEPRSIFER